MLEYAIEFATICAFRKRIMMSLKKEIAVIAVASLSSLIVFSFHFPPFVSFDRSHHHPATLSSETHRLQRQRHH
jgi:hypothetical protein